MIIEVAFGYQKGIETEIAHYKQIKDSV